MRERNMMYAVIIMSTLAGMFIVSCVSLLFCTSTPTSAPQAEATVNSDVDVSHLSDIGKILVGEHQLHKLGVPKEDVVGGYFIFLGGSDEDSGSVTVKFQWLMNDGVYAVSSLPLEKFRIKIDNSIAEPTIKFRWSLGFQHPDIQYIMNSRIIYALLTIKESDWPVDIKISVNQ